MVRNDKEKPMALVYRDGFQRPKRKQWRPKAIRDTPNVYKAKSSKVNKEAVVSDTMVGVGSIKQIEVEPKKKEKVHQEAPTVKPLNQSGEGEFCTVNAGRTPGSKDGGMQGSQLNGSGPELVKSVVQTFKQHLKPRRGVVISENSNRFSPLTSEEASDDDDMTIIDTSRLHVGDDLGNIGSVDTVDLGAAPTSLSQ